MNQAVKTFKNSSLSYIKSRLFIMDVTKVFAASLVLSLLAIAKVPMLPVPITLQTLGVFLIGLSLRPSLAVSSIALYLTWATCGFPVLSGMTSNPLWMFSPVAGFLFSFLPAAFVISFFSSKVKSVSFLKTLGCIILGQLVVYLLGVSWLAALVGLKKAVVGGILPFIPGMFYKAMLAASLYRPLDILRKKV